MGLHHLLGRKDDICDRGVGRYRFHRDLPPHYYSSIVEWSDRFGGAPVYIHELDRKWVQRKSPKIIHELDRKWVQRKSPKITYWKGERTSPLPGLEIINLGGHFDGSSVLYWRSADSKGILFSGNTIYVVMDRPWGSFMYSYPNHIPLPARKVRAIASRIKRYEFEDMYSGFEEREIIGGADLAVQASARRYISHLK